MGNVWWLYTLLKSVCAAIGSKRSSAAVFIKSAYTYVGSASAALLSLPPEPAASSKLTAPARPAPPLVSASLLIWEASCILAMVDLSRGSEPPGFPNCFLSIFLYSVSLLETGALNCLLSANELKRGSKSYTESAAFGMWSKRRPLILLVFRETSVKRH